MGRRSLPPIRLLVVVAGCAFLGACAQTKVAPYGIKEASAPDQGKPTGQYKVGKPYQIQGVWYYPAEDYSYDESGIASWYGPDFHGKYTANGEIFDQNSVTAAHRTLPMPCFVRVTNLENGRELVVRVNDRGPFAHGRILDLSRRSAQLLGIEGRGTAKVRVTIMAEESRALALRMKANQGEQASLPPAPRETVQAETLPPPGSREPPKPVIRPVAAAARPSAVVVDTPRLESQEVKVVPVKPTQIFVQAGAFTSYSNAHRLSASLAGIGQTTITQVHTKSGTFFRVRMGPLANVDDADALLEKVIGSGYPEATVVVN